MTKRHSGAIGVLVGAAALVMAAGTADAAPRLLEKFNDWSAYINEDGGQKLCFVISQPTSSVMNPAGRNRDPGFFFVSFRPSENVNGEISVAYGYPLAPNSTRAEIGSDTFSLYARDESAWIENSAEEAKLVDAMRAGAAMKVYGTSSRGTSTVDTYSLSGITAALQRVSRECGN